MGGSLSTYIPFRGQEDKFCNFLLQSGALDFLDSDRSPRQEWISSAPEQGNE